MVLTTYILIILLWKGTAAMSLAVQSTWLFGCSEILWYILDAEEVGSRA